MGSLKLKKCLIACIAGGSTITAAQSLPAAMVASDDAGNSAYPVPGSGYLGDNGGTGFQAWQGASQNYIASTGTTGSFISPILTNGNAFAVWAGGGYGSTTDGIYRSFINDSGGTSDPALDVGQSVSLDFEMRAQGFTGYDGEDPPQPVYATGPKGFSLGSSSAVPFTFDVPYGTTGPFFYEVNGVATTFAATAADPIELTFTLTSPTTYSFSIQDLAASSPQATYNTTGTFADPADLTQINIFQNGNSNNDVYFNSLAVSPEPGSLCLLCLGSLTLLGRRRSQQVG
jgi:hypothetical protein